MKNKKAVKTEKVNVATPEEIATANRAEDARIEKIIALRWPWVKAMSEGRESFIAWKQSIAKDGKFPRIKFCPTCGQSQFNPETWKNEEHDLKFRSCKNPKCGTHFAVCLKY